jgi:hypothetical protein
MKEQQELVIELAPIQLSTASREADLVETSDRLQDEFLQGRQGFLGRVLLKRGDGQYLDLVLWESLNAANAVIAAVADSAACAAYFGCMVMGTDPAEDVEHWSIVRSYGLVIPASLDIPEPAAAPAASPV